MFVSFKFVFFSFSVSCESLKMLVMGMVAVGWMNMDGWMDGGDGVCMLCCMDFNNAV